MKIFENKKNIAFALVFALIIIGTFVYFIVSKTGEGDLSSNGFPFGADVFPGEQLQDTDGNVYNTVQVGEQIWMAENLNAIPKYGKSFCYNNEIDYCNRYGRLYDWEAAMEGSEEPGSQGVCPDGWYVPTDEDWHILESAFSEGTCDGSRLGWGCYPAASFMKTEDWGGTEDSVFKVLPAGFIKRGGRSGLLNSYSYFWTSSKIGDGVWKRGFLDSQENIFRSTENPEYGYSIRCIKK